MQGVVLLGVSADHIAASSYLVGDHFLEKDGIESEANMDLETRNRLFATLADLPQPQFEQLLFSLKPPAGTISGGEAPQGNRVSDFLAWVEGPSSTYTLEQVDGMLAGLLNRP
ncbi:MAG: hypothetical protein QNJ46_14185 [Leptolyngbyaceae cyanobacterium MO_188.B28]|nr:hypothetical protein [Leptolyngbyaceae cyanobacterium MO_188.B28]